MTRTLTPEESARRQAALERLYLRGVLYWNGKKWTPAKGWLIPVGGVHMCIVCGGWDGEHGIGCPVEELERTDGESRG